MEKSRVTMVVLLAAVGLLAGPLLSANGDMIAAAAFANGKFVVQCPPDPFGVTGIGLPGLGFNKNKQCSWAFSNANAAKATDICIGAGRADPLKKGNKKAPLEAGLCTITAAGTLGPVLQWPGPNIKIPAGLNALCVALGKPKNGSGGCDITKNQGFGGPWCGFHKGQSGAGILTIGTKVINFDRIRWQAQGKHVVVTASAFKPGVSKPGQAGPMVMLLLLDPDEHKVIAGMPFTSCLAGAKELKIDLGIVRTHLVGTK